MPYLHGSATVILTKQECEGSAPRISMSPFYLRKDIEKMFLRHGVMQRSKGLFLELMMFF